MAKTKNWRHERGKDFPGLFIKIVDAASCRILGKSGKMPLLQFAFMNNANCYIVLPQEDNTTPSL
ncbi:MAG: hypothetical protein IT426_02895 [Pirellulales bacterium]|nr:hypothetical protein [Pirellulales bacterium]